MEAISSFASYVVAYKINNEDQYREKFPLTWEIALDSDARIFADQMLSDDGA